MTTEKFEEIMGADNDSSWDGDNALKGLLIISKYMSHDKHELIAGANHDIIYSVGVEEIVEAGITEDDTQALRDLNWMIQDGEYLACFV